MEDDRIVAAEEVTTFATNGFSDQMWEPFAASMTLTYPHDAAVMYADWQSQGGAALNDRSLALWAQHIQDYVSEKK